MKHFNPNTVQERQSARHGILGRRILVILGVLALAWLISVWSAETTRRSAMEVGVSPLVTGIDSEGLIQALENDTSADVRSRAATALGELNKAHAVIPLEHAVASDPSMRVRDAATDALALLQGYWARNAGKQSEYVGGLAVAPGNSDLVYLAALNELVVSRDGGVTWTALGNPLPSHVSAIAVDPSQRNVIYAGADSLGLYKSVDEGETWHAVNDGLGMAAGVRLRITALAIDPENSDRIYAARGVWIGTSRVELIPLGLMESRDSGATWYGVEVPALDQAIERLVVINDKLYATAGEQLFAVELTVEDEL